MLYYPRHLERKIKEALATKPVIFINGPRQAGKSTFVEHVSAADYITLDNLTTLSAATSDPEGFLRGFTRPVIIDEIQRAPALFSVLKLLTDEYRRHGAKHSNGRFLLTGSTNLMTIPELSAMLVGRMAVLTLYPLSAAEACLRDIPTIIDQWFDDNISYSKYPEDELPLHEVIAHSTFPEISIAQQNHNLWYESYINTLLQRDVKELADIEKISALPNILTLLASRAGSLLNDADAARDAKLNPMTYRRYRTLLEQVFLITLVQPWHGNIGKRLTKSPKLFFTDTALLCHQLGVNLSTTVTKNPILYGHIVENFVASELMKQLTLTSSTKLHYYRTHDGHEIDFIIERSNGDLLCIEVKTSATVTSSDFAVQRIFKKEVGKKFIRGIILYSGKETIAFAEDLFAIPISTLWGSPMILTTDKDIRRLHDQESYVFWATYKNNRIRCKIKQTTVDDYFSNNASEQQSIATILKQWNIIWPIFQKKILSDQIDHVAVGSQNIQEVVLHSDDFERRDFR